jgi:hypothetical protein
MLHIENITNGKRMVCAPMRHMVCAIFRYDTFQHRFKHILCSWVIRLLLFETGQRFHRNTLAAGGGGDATLERGNVTIGLSAMTKAS